MSETITLTKLDDAADQIISRFASKTRLEGEDTGAEVVFEVDHHDLHVTRTLDSIDPDWPEHVGFSDPA
jgi:hypothetical protein